MFDHEWLRSPHLPRWGAGNDWITDETCRCDGAWLDGARWVCELEERRYDKQRHRFGQNVSHDHHHHDDDHETEDHHYDEAEDHDHQHDHDHNTTHHRTAANGTADNYAPNRTAHDYAAASHRAAHRTAATAAGDRTAYRATCTTRPRTGPSAFGASSWRVLPIPR